MTDLVLQNVTLRYGKTTVLAIADDRFDGPSLTALTGANGSGKTTLLQLAAGLMVPTTGSVALSNGAGSKSVLQPKVRSSISFVPDRPILFDDLSLFDNVEHVVRLVGQRAADPLGRSLWQAFDLDELGQRFPLQLSRGQRQKASLAVALSRPASVVLLDEPTIGLDTDTRSAVTEVLVEEGKERLIIAATHDHDLIDRCRSVVRLEEGDTCHD